MACQYLLMCDSHARDDTARDEIDLWMFGIFAASPLLVMLLCLRAL